MRSVIINSVIIIIISIHLSIFCTAFCHYQTLLHTGIHDVV